MGTWVDVCDLDEIDPEDIMRWDHGERTFAIYRSPESEVFATDGLRAHEPGHLAGGLAMDHMTKCPKHDGQLDDRTGKGSRVPACVTPRTSPAQVAAGRVAGPFLRLPA